MAMGQYAVISEGYFLYTCSADNHMESLNGPPADKRDLTTFCNMLSNTHFKSVKNHHFTTAAKQVSSMGYA